MSTVKTDQTAWMYKLLRLCWVHIILLFLWPESIMRSGLYSRDLALPILNNFKSCCSYPEVLFEPTKPTE